MNKTVWWQETRDIITSECGWFCDPKCPHNFASHGCDISEQGAPYNDRTPLVTFGNQRVRTDWCKKNEV